ASFAHSKRCREVRLLLAVDVGASMFQGATEPRGSVWSARSLLPLWRVGRQPCSLRGSIPATQKARCPRSFSAVPVLPVWFDQRPFVIHSVHDRRATTNQPSKPCRFRRPHV